jgi:hypothetical protein
MKNEEILEDNISYLVQEMKSMKQNHITPQYNKLFPALPTAVDRVAKNQAVIVIKNNNENEATHVENMTKLKDAVVQSSAAVVKTYKNGVKDTVLICQNEASKNKLLPHVNTIFPQHKVSTPQSRLPTFCGKCGEEHDTRECQSDIKKCINCTINSARLIMKHRGRNVQATNVSKRS